MTDADALAEEITFSTLSNGTLIDDLYEHFLRAYAPARRRAHGVFFTPAQLVHAQVRLAVDVLDHSFGCVHGFADARVTLVDPAAGTGAYVLAAIADAARRGADVQVISQRITAFEPRIGAALLLRAQLAAALGGVIADVRVEDALESDYTPLTPIVACIGNPPYRRGKALPGRSLNGFAAAGGLHLKNVYNAYVYFWRWALDVLVRQRQGPALVSLLTPASFLTGPGFAEMRAELRGAFDDLWVLDLGGDGLGARPTENVFQIRTPVAVAMGVRYGDEPRRSARVWYAQLSGTRAQKLGALDAIARVDDVAWERALDAPKTALRPRRTSEYHSWPRLTELFPVVFSGCQMKRTWPIAPAPELLHARWVQFLALDASERARAFRPTRDRHVGSTPPDLLDPRRRMTALDALPRAAAALDPVPYAYRSFDRQWVLPDSRLGDFMRPRLWRIAGPRQIFLTSTLTSVLGAGPAAVATALVPDLDHFRGSFGGRAVIPLWLDSAASEPNVDASLLESLTQRLGCQVFAEDLFAYSYALLSSTAYVQRFAEELLEPGPRIPLPRDLGLFERAVGLGRELLWVHTFGARIFRERPLSGTAGWHAAPSEHPRSFTYRVAEDALHVGDGVVGPVAPPVWDFAVSGLRVVRSWLNYRISPARRPSRLDDIRPRWTERMTRELLEVLWVLEATLALQPALAALLEEVVT